MVITDKLKQLVFKRLYKELRNVEIIPYNDSIWFIDREKEYWYFEFEKDGRLWWRYGFFINFFEIFSFCESDFDPILSAWVEEVLNHKVSTTQNTDVIFPTTVEEVLNHKVSTTTITVHVNASVVEEVLNHKVSTTKSMWYSTNQKVEEVLNHKVTTTDNIGWDRQVSVEEALNHKVTAIDTHLLLGNDWMEEILNQK